MEVLVWNLQYKELEKTFGYYKNENSPICTVLILSSTPGDNALSWYKIFLRLLPDDIIGFSATFLTKDVEL